MFKGFVLRNTLTCKTITRNRFTGRTKKQKRQTVKLKRKPEDFIVEEVTDTFKYKKDGGPISVYSLKKTSMETQHAIYALAAEFGVERDDVHFGGLKDKHAITTQYITIENGPKRNLNQKSFSVTYLGGSKEHFKPTDILGNKFNITLRNISADVIPAMNSAISVRSKYGFPNYYGSQRFGSVGQTGEFVAKLWCAREFERALHLLFTDEYQHEKSSQVQFRQLAANNWGQWQTIIDQCNKKIENVKDVKLHLKVLENLIEKPNDYMGAFMKFPKHVRAIWLSAYQSYIWNVMTSKYIEKFLSSDSNNKFYPQFLSPTLKQIGDYNFYQDISEVDVIRLKRIQIPMISKRTYVSVEPLIDEIIKETLDDIGITVDQLNVPHPRDCFFTNISRNLIEFPVDLSHKWLDDKHYSDKKSLHLNFRLGRGVYATTFFSALHSYVSNSNK